MNGNKNYTLMPETETYAWAVEALRESYKNGECTLQPLYTKPDGSCIARPLTIRENLQALVENYNTLKNADGNVRNGYERMHLFGRSLDSCTGITFKACTSKFKIVPKCGELITIDKDFKGSFLQVDYNFIDGIELDSNDAKYGTLLTSSEVKSHPAWLTAVEEDAALLSEYADILFSLLKKQYKRTDWMSFNILSNPETYELSSLYINNLNDDSNGFNGLDCKGSFIMIVPPQKTFTRNRSAKQ